MNVYLAQIEAGNCAVIGVCECCRLVQANGECCAEDHGSEDYPEPLSLIGTGDDVSAGMPLSEHTCGKEDMRRAVNAECWCEHFGFTSLACQGCGSRLAGDRFALFVVYGVRDPE